MSLLGSLFNLPSVPKLDLPKLDTKVMSYSTASPQKLIDESYTHVNNVFGGTGPFTTLGTNIPTFTELSSSTFLGNVDPLNPFAGIGMSELTKFSTAESPFTASQVRESVGGDSTTEDNYHKVKLVSDVQYSAETALIDLGGLNFEPYNQMEVVFDIMPEVSENHDVAYEALSPSQLPGEFQKYKNTSSTKWTITGQFTARTREEAYKNYVYLQTLRTWTKPYFGEKQDQQFPNKLGAPPPIVMFSGWRGLVGRVPTVITSIQWNWPNSCDWIPTGLLDDETNREIPFPTVMNVTINLVETFSPNQFNNFDLVSYHYGDMVNAWDQPGATGVLNRRLEDPTPSIGGTTANPTVQDPGTESTENSSIDVLNGSALLYLKSNQSDFLRYNTFDGTTDTIPSFEDEGGFA